MGEQEVYHRNIQIGLKHSLFYVIIIQNTHILFIFELGLAGRRTVLCQWVGEKCKKGGK